MLTKNRNPKVWCDYCKGRWGQLRDGSWALQAQTPAVWIVTSTNPRFANQTRHYCNRCALEITHWACECGDPYRCSNRWDLDKQTMDYIQGDINEL